MLKRKNSLALVSFSNDGVCETHFHMYQMKCNIFGLRDHICPSETIIESIYLLYVLCVIPLIDNGTIVNRIARNPFTLCIYLT